MSDVVLLTDTVLWGDIGNGRYMGAYAIAAELRKRGHSCTIIDYFTRHPDFFSYLKNFINSETRVLGISSTFLAPLQSPKKREQRSEGLSAYYSGELWFEDPRELQKWLKDLKLVLSEWAPLAKIVIGGVKSQFAIWRPENFQEIDYVFLGSADHTFSNFVEALKKGIEPKWELRNGKKVVDTTFDIEHKSCPVAFWTFQDAIQKKESLPLEVARGCIFNCKFCHYNKKASFKKNLNQLREELIRNYELWGVDTYSFCDDCFNDHPEKVENICRMFLDLPFKIEWVAYARVDVAVKFPHTLDLMIESGACGLYWGIESFNHEVARRAGKGTPPERVKELLIRMGKELKGRCLTEISLISGLPGETFESLQQTEDWLVNNPVADLVTIGSLGLAPYVQDFDQKSMDYADYSRNPEKYGFKRVEFKPHFWEHEQMNSTQAAEWARKIKAAYVQARPTGFAQTIWLYPHLKSLGFKKTEIFELYRSNTDQNYFEVKNRFSQFLESYFDQLKTGHASFRSPDVGNKTFINHKKLQSL
jgi:radical SAM superfamily enzyme YgiQ (UPF0313 family)